MQRHHIRPPVLPEPGEHDPEETISWAKLRPFDRSLQHTQLMPKSQILGREGGLPAEHCPHEDENRTHDIHQLPFR